MRPLAPRPVAGYQEGVQGKPRRGHLYLHRASAFVGNKRAGASPYGDSEGPCCCSSTGACVCGRSAAQLSGSAPCMTGMSFGSASSMSSRANPLAPPSSSASVTVTASPAARQLRQQRSPGAVAFQAAAHHQRQQDSSEVVRSSAATTNRIFFPGEIHLF